MAFDGSGNYNRIHNWTSDAANGLDINAGEMDAEDNSIAGAFNITVTRDGQGKMAADFTPQTDNIYNLGVGAKRWKSINGLPIAPLSNSAGDIRNYGAVTGTDCAAAVTSAAAVNSLVIFPAGTWPMAATPTIPTGVILQALPGAIFSGAGAGALGFSTSYTVGNQTSDYSPAPPTAGGTGELSSFNYFRNATGTTGGASTVGNALRIQTNVAAGVVNLEWGFLSVLNNSATAGQNVAGYMQGNKLTGAGPTWAAVMESQDKSGNANPTTGHIGAEIDLRASGTDNNLLRVGLDIVLTRYPYNSGAAVTFGYGQRVGSFGDAGVTINAGYTVWDTTVGYAFDCANATVTAGAIRMPSTAPILFDAIGGTNVNAMHFNGVGGAAAGLDYTVSGTPFVRLNQSGAVSINTSGVMTQIIGPQQSTLVAAAAFVQVDTTTAVSTDSTFDGYTLKQVVRALRVHGLLA
jgi:hypothetical protein